MPTGPAQHPSQAYGGGSATTAIPGDDPLPSPSPEQEPRPAPSAEWPRRKSTVPGQDTAMHASASLAFEDDPLAEAAAKSEPKLPEHQPREPVERPRSPPALDTVMRTGTTSTQAGTNGTTVSNNTMHTSTTSLGGEPAPPGTSTEAHQKSGAPSRRYQKYASRLVTPTPVDSTDAALEAHIAEHPAVIEPTGEPLGKPDAGKQDSGGSDRRSDEEHEALRQRVAQHHDEQRKLSAEREPEATEPKSAEQYGEEQARNVPQSQMVSMPSPYQPPQSVQAARASQSAHPQFQQPNFADLQLTPSQPWQHAQHAQQGHLQSAHASQWNQQQAHQQHGHPPLGFPQHSSQSAATSGSVPGAWGTTSTDSRSTISQDGHRQQMPSGQYASQPVEQPSLAGMGLPSFAPPQHQLPPQWLQQQQQHQQQLQQPQSGQLAAGSLPFSSAPSAGASVPSSAMTSWDAQLQWQGQQAPQAWQQMQQSQQQVHPGAPRFQGAGRGEEISAAALLNASFDRSARPQ
jgi:hypothetical protein